MCPKATTVLATLSLSVAAAVLHAQIPGIGTDWRKVGGSTIDLGLASPAGGPVERVWYSASGNALYVRTGFGTVWKTSDFEHWTAAGDRPPLRLSRTPVRYPEKNPVVTVSASTLQSRMFAAGQFVWKSDDGGATWTSLTAFRGASIIGGPMADLAVSPLNPDEVVVAGATGVWRSVDGGASWSGLNDGLPNLPVTRLLQVPGSDGPATRVLTAGDAELANRAGDGLAWRPAGGIAPLLAAENAVRALAPDLTTATAATRAADWAFIGTADGRLLASGDRGRNWRESGVPLGTGLIERIAADPRDGRFAVAITRSAGAARVLRTTNGGIFWDDISADLPPGALYGVAVERPTGAVYLAAASGVWYTYTDPVAASPATSWIRLRPEPARDVFLDSAGHQLYVALEGWGIYAAIAPHRARDPRVVSAGDRILKAVAPGSVLSVLGARIQSARAGDRPAVVLAASESESQVQLPWDLAGSVVTVQMNSAANGRIQLGLPLAETAPSIFLDRDGTPILTDADSGLMLDAATPARSGTRLHILATGLGRVTPVWPPGLPAPLQDPPKVNAPVRAWLDREPMEVLSATLAPGYAGLYLVEIQLPALVNRGPAELYLEAGTGTSNRVRVWLEP